MLPKTEPALLAKPLALHRRLVLALLLPLLAILIASAWLDYHTASSMADQTHDMALTDTVFDLESHIGSKHNPLELDLSKEAEAILRSNLPDNLFFAVQGPAGQLLAGSNDLTPASLPRNYRQILFSDGLLHGQAVRFAVLRTNRNGLDFIVTVAETTLRRQRARSRILTAMLLPNLAVIFAALVVVVLGVRRGLLPLRDVEEEIGRRSVSDLREIDLATAPIEVHPMLKRLNELFHLLEKASQAQQRFIADAAHQLKTPLTGLQNQLDLAAAEGIFNAHPARLARLEEATQRISHLLNQLLAYAHTENANQITASFERVCLSTLLEQAASEFLDAALAKDIDLGFDLAPVQVQGVTWMLHEALANLIDNAIRYTPIGGVITARCASQDGHAFLEVEDNGPGISPADRERVFERFYRIPGSPGGGCGLGLPIVREIARLHLAEISLTTTNESGGLKVRLNFPPENGK